MGGTPRHCQETDCHDLVHCAVQSLQYDCLVSIVKYVNELKKRQLDDAVHQYLRYIPIKSSGIGSIPVNFISMQVYSDPIDRKLAHMSCVDDSLIVRDQMRTSAGLAGQTCIFRINQQGSCRLLLECLLDEETRAVRLSGMNALCAKHMSEPLPKIWFDIVLSNKHAYLKML